MPLRSNKRTFAELEQWRVECRGMPASKTTLGSVLLCFVASFLCTIVDDSGPLDLKTDRNLVED